MKNYISIIATLVLALSLSGCLKDRIKNNGNVNYETLAEDATISENISEDLFKVVDEESKNGQYSNDVGKNDLGVVQYKSAQDTCAVVTLDFNGGNFPMYLTIDFGTGCTDAYGVVRKGKVMIEYTDNYSNAGAEVNVSVDGYTVNGYLLEGTKNITNDGRNLRGNLQFTVRDQNVIITKPNNGGQISWESVRINEWTDGENTNFFTNGLSGICDDTYSITGYGEGTTSDGQDYRLDIVDPLIKDVCCLWVNDGSIKYTVNGSELATLNYGDGTCDYNANLNYNGNSYVIIIQ